MNIITRTIESIFPPHRPLPVGIYPYQTPPDAPFQYRLHLRIEANGEGILIVNAKTVLHLNQTATEMAYHLIKDTPEADALALIAHRYHVPKEQTRQDFQGLKQRLQTMINTPDLDPGTYLDFERRDPHSTDLSAPLRLDCALTYKLTEPAGQDLAPVERVRRELLDEEWKIILDKAWNAGIPHVIFTGGEPTLRPDLPDLIAHAEKLGQVAGLITDGFRLTDAHYFHQLLQAGLDHLMIVLHEDDEQAWEAVRDAIQEDIFTTVHLTILHSDASKEIEIIDQLAGMGIKSISLSVADPALVETMHVVRQAVAERQIPLIWDLPVPYSHLHPVALELAENESKPNGAGKVWLYVEPDGDVLPAQGMPDHVLGNMLNDPWDTIWQKH
ncbi:MAG: radical SAM protein [Chloroflexi bacterium]|nr:radical SAM protein [Chloroflexota bacterium]